MKILEALTWYILTKSVIIDKLNNIKTIKELNDFKLDFIKLYGYDFYQRYGYRMFSFREKQIRRCKPL